MKVHFAEIVRLANLHLSSDDAKRILWGDIHTSRLAALHNIKCALLTHSGEKAHKCTRYNTSFSRTAHLKTHLLTHSGEKPHKCAECNKSFSRAGHLRTHLRTHSGKKPHKSTQCEKSFSQGAHLRTHLLAHSGEKVHMCSVHWMQQIFQSSWGSEETSAHSLWREGSPVSSVLNATKYSVERLTNALNSP